MAGDDEVTSPDQHKPGNLRAARIGGVVTMLVLLSMLFGNNEISGTEKAWLIGMAGLIGAVLVGDWVLRKNGLRA